MNAGDKEKIGPYELHHPDDFPPVTEDPYHLIAFLLKSPHIACSRTIIDIGTATGVIPLLLASRSEISHITGVEIDMATAKCAKENIERNGLDKRIEIINSDYRELPDRFEAASFDIVVSNPPYIKRGHGRKSGNKRRHIARYEELGELSELIRVAGYLLTEEGRLFMIFPVKRKAELIDEFNAVGLSVVREETIAGLFMVETAF